MPNGDEHRQTTPEEYVAHYRELQKAKYEWLRERAQLEREISGLKQTIKKMLEIKRENE